MHRIEQEVRQIFEWLCQTPHPSGKEQALAQRITERLAEIGLHPWKDAYGNVFCDVPASQGREQEPCMALQAHLDMVCAVGSTDYVPERDPIQPIERDGWLCTAGASSLGADCGAGVAAMLWAAQHIEEHPPLRLIFTVEEEIGLKGAQQLDPKGVEGVRYLVNTDGFHWGRIVTGAASGVRERYTRSLVLAKAPELPKGQAYRLTLDGFQGGHSGFDIGRRHENALVLMGELLRELRMESPFALIDFEGGTAFNAIPYQCRAEVLTIAPVREVIELIGARIEERWRVHEPNGRLTIEEIALPDMVWDGDAASGLLTVLGGFADGVYAMHAHIPNAVADSSNLGHVYAADGVIYLDAMIRCMDAQAEQALQTSHRMVAGMCGFTGTITSRYPVWQEQTDSHLCKTAAACYQKITGQEPEIMVQHVGLEPSLLLEKNPDMECICVGMELADCHSPKERWRLDTIAPFLQMLAELMRTI